MFCDMSEKTLWPVCAGGDAAASRCFDMDTRTVRGSDGGFPTTNATLFTGGAKKAVTQVAVPNKSYTSVSTWDP